MLTLGLDIGGAVAERYLFLGGGGTDQPSAGIHEIHDWLELALTLRKAPPRG